MTVVLPFLRNLFATTFASPREAARQLLALGLPSEARWIAAGLVVVLSLLVSQFALLGMPADPASPLDAFVRDPVAGFVTQAAIVLGLAFGMTTVGRWFGGAARFDDALLLVTWTDFVLLIVNIVVLAVTIVLPFLSLAGAVLTLVVFIWLLTHFAAYLNGFTSLPKVLLGVILSLVVGAFLFGFLMLLLGFGPPMAEVS